MFNVTGSPDKLKSNFKCRHIGYTHKRVTLRQAKIPPKPFQKSIDLFSLIEPSRSMPQQTTKHLRDLLKYPSLFRDSVIGVTVSRSCEV
jgi:hypothetical protein